MEYDMVPVRKTSSLCSSTPRNPGRAMSPRIGAEPSMARPSEIAKKLDGPEGKGKGSLIKEGITRLGVGRLSGLWANLPGYDLFERLLDVFASRQKVRLIVTSEGYCELKILWGAIEFTKGSK